MGPNMKELGKIIKEMNFKFKQIKKVKILKFGNLYRLIIYFNYLFIFIKELNF